MKAHPGRLDRGCPWFANGHQLKARQLGAGVVLGRAGLSCVGTHAWIGKSRCTCDSRAVLGSSVIMLCVGVMAKRSTTAQCRSHMSADDQSKPSAHPSTTFGLYEASTRQHAPNPAHPPIPSHPGEAARCTRQTSIASSSRKENSCVGLSHRGCMYRTLRAQTTAVVNDLETVCYPCFSSSHIRLYLMRSAPSWPMNFSRSAPGRLLILTIASSSFSAAFSSS